MIQARLKVKVPNKQVASSLIEAVEPDNQMPHLKVVGRALSDSLTFNLEFKGEVETFIFTLDDLLRCLQAAMETLRSIKTEEIE